LESKYITGLNDQSHFIGRKKRGEGEKEVARTDLRWPLATLGEGEGGGKKVDNEGGKEGNVVDKGPVPVLTAGKGPEHWNKAPWERKVEGNQTGMNKRMLAVPNIQGKLGETTKTPYTGENLTSLKKSERRRKVFTETGTGTSFKKNGVPKRPGKG